jgi:intracellular multiplication protein IcmP
MAQAPGQQNSSDQTANFFWLIVIIFGAVFAVWYFRRQWIVEPIFLMRVAEIHLMTYALMAWNFFAQKLNFPVFDFTQMEQAKHFIATMPVKTVSVENFSLINDYIGNLVRYPIAAILAILGIYSYLRHGSMLFKNTHTMDTLKKAEQENWPQITPVLSIDLVKEDPEVGPWSMPKRPLDFCKENNIARLTTNPDAEDRFLWAIDEGVATRVFTMQIGPLWQGVDKLPIHTKALLVVFMARVHRERAVASKLLAQIAASSAHGKLNFEGVTELLEKYRNSQYLKWAEKRHAYVYTLMATLLEMGRSDGVIATAEFLWLKPVDRRLWFMLNTVGRQTAVIEVAGPFAHWLAERKLKRKLKTPMVKEAVSALETEMQNILHIPDEEKWHTSNAA